MFSFRCLNIHLSSAWGSAGLIYLMRNVGAKTDPRFANPVTMRCFGEPIRITNHGPPIPEAQLPELFQLFQSRRDKHTNAGQAGQHLGLGLYIARLICERHGGDLKAENLKQASGVVFTARLPLAG